MERLTRRYAHGTSVPADRTREEIAKLLEKRGATSFVFGTSTGQAMIVFELEQRRMRFLVPMPTSKRSEAEAKTKAEVRRRWRALLLVLKAKLEAVDSKITTLDEEFLAHIMISGNTTVGDRIIPGLHGAITSGGDLPPLLGPGSP